MSDHGKTLAEILPEMAEAAQRNPDGWVGEFERTEVGSTDHWMPLRYYGFSFDPTCKYRRKPKIITRWITHTVGLTVEPKEGDWVWVVDVLSMNRVWVAPYKRSWHKHMFERGLLHATEEAAMAHYRALVGEDGDA